jgi:hypothetical protein
MTVFGSVGPWLVVLGITAVGVAAGVLVLRRVRPDVLAAAASTDGSSDDSDHTGATAAAAVDETGETSGDGPTEPRREPSGEETAPQAEAAVEARPDDVEALGDEPESGGHRSRATEAGDDRRRRTADVDQSTGHSRAVDSGREREAVGSGVDTAARGTADGREPSDDRDRTGDESARSETAVRAESGPTADGEPTEHEGPVTVPTSVLAPARRALDAGDVERAVRVAYRAVSEELTARGDIGTHRTHREFDRACREAFGDDLDALTRLVDLFERVSYANGAGVDTETVGDVLDALVVPTDARVDGRDANDDRPRRARRE